MNLHDLTLPQIRTILTFRELMILITYILTAIGTVATGAYMFGQKIAEAQSLADIAEAKGSIAQLQAKLEIAQSKIESSSSANKQLQDAHQKIQEVFAKQSKEVAFLNLMLEGKHNCEFIHGQIRDTREEMSHTGSPTVINADPAWHQEQILRQEKLERRLLGYQQQLGTCDK